MEENCGKEKREASKGSLNCSSVTAKRQSPRVRKYNPPEEDESRDNREGPSQPLRFKAGETARGRVVTVHTVEWGNYGSFPHQEQWIDLQMVRIRHFRTLETSQISEQPGEFLTGKNKMNLREGVLWCLNVAPSPAPQPCVSLEENRRHFWDR